jgi:hypothetical protein
MTTLVETHVTEDDFCGSRMWAALLQNRLIRRVLCKIPAVGTLAAKEMVHNGTQ